MKKIIVGVSILILMMNNCLASDLFDKYSKKLTPHIYYGTNSGLGIGATYEFPVDETFNGEIGATYNFPTTAPNSAGGSTTYSTVPVEFNLKVYSQNKTGFAAGGLNYSFWDVSGTGTSNNIPVSVIYKPTGIGYQVSVGTIVSENLFVSIKYLVMNVSGVAAGQSLSQSINQNLSQSSNTLILGIDVIQ